MASVIEIFKNFPAPLPPPLDVEKFLMAPLPPPLALSKNFSATAIATATSQKFLAPPPLPLPPKKL